MVLVFLLLALGFLKFTDWGLLTLGLSVFFLLLAFVSMLICGLKAFPKRTKSEAMWDAFWHTLIGQIWR